DPIHARQSINVPLEVPVLSPSLLYISFRHQKFGRNAVAKSLDALARAIVDLADLHVGNTGDAEPDVREFMGQRENLSCLRVGTIDENNRRNLVGYREPSELSDR